MKRDTFLGSYARRFFPLFPIPVVVIAIIPGTVLAKLVGVLFGIALTLLEHYIEWVVIPSRRRNRAAADALLDPTRSKPGPQSRRSRRSAPDAASPPRVAP